MESNFRHRTGTSYWAYMNQSMWEREFIDYRFAVSTFANIPQGEFRGMRAPYLQTGGDRTFDMIQENHLLYDSSYPTFKYRKDGLFPYTLDYTLDYHTEQVRPISIYIR